MIRYSIPGMYELQKVNEIFLTEIKVHPEVLYDDVAVEAVYGTPQFCIWDGGRIFPGYTQATAEQVAHMTDMYNCRFNLPVRYIFTNCALEEKNYNNRFGHILMQIASQYPNEVVVADDRFMHFLKNCYPGYKYFSSTTKCILDKAEVIAELEKDGYFRVCLDYNLNKDTEFLKGFTDKQKEKTEFLVNPICSAACPHRKKHYYLNSLSHLNFGRMYTMEGCYVNKNIFQREANENNLSYQQIKEVYEPMGFEHFKIEGRTWNAADLLLTYANYMIKPEWKDFVISEVMMGVGSNA